MTGERSYRVNIDGTFTVDGRWVRTCHGQYTIKAKRPQEAWSGARRALDDECLARHGATPDDHVIRDWALLPEEKP